MLYFARSLPDYEIIIAVYTCALKNIDTLTLLSDPRITRPDTKKPT